MTENSSRKQGQEIKNLNSINSPGMQIESQFAVFIGWRLQYGSIVIRDHLQMTSKFVRDIKYFIAYKVCFCDIINRLILWLHKNS